MYIVTPIIGPINHIPKIYLFYVCIQYAAELGPIHLLLMDGPSVKCV